MTPNLKELFRLSEDHIELASEITARAFFNDPVLVYYFPDEDNRKNDSKYIFEYLFRYAVLYGEVYAISKNLEGIAAWRPPEDVFITPKRQIISGAKKVISMLGWDFINRTAPNEEYIKSIHKKHAPFPHWYLSPIVVDPVHQGKGYATILLKAMINRIDKEQLPIYLYTNIERNARMYLHFGFKVIEELIIPGTKIKHWSMLRQKRE